MCFIVFSTAVGIRFTMKITKRRYENWTSQKIMREADALTTAPEPTRLRSYSVSCVYCVHIEHVAVKQGRISGGRVRFHPLAKTKISKIKLGSQTALPPVSSILL